MSYSKDSFNRDTLPRSRSRTLIIAGGYGLPRSLFKKRYESATLAGHGPAPRPAANDLQAEWRGAMPRGGHFQQAPSVTPGRYVPATRRPFHQFSAMLESAYTRITWRIGITRRLLSDHSLSQPSTSIVRFPSDTLTVVIVALPYKAACTENRERGAPIVETRRTTRVASCSECGGRYASGSRSQTRSNVTFPSALKCRRFPSNRYLRGKSVPTEAGLAIAFT